MQKIIHHNLVEFIPEMQVDWINTGKSLKGIHTTYKKRNT